MSKRKENHFESIDEEVLFLRKQNASLRGINATLKKEAERYRGLDREGDELNERRIAEIDKLNESIMEKDKVVAGLESQVNELKGVIANRLERIKELKGDVAVAEANLEYYRTLPWYKRIFKKG